MSARHRSVATEPMVPEETTTTPRAIDVFRLPRTSELVSPVLDAVPLPRIPCHSTVLPRRDVEQPLSVAKGASAA